MFDIYSKSSFGLGFFSVFVSSVFVKSVYIDLERKHLHVLVCACWHSVNVSCMHVLCGPCCSQIRYCEKSYLFSPLGLPCFNSLSV